MKVLNMFVTFLLIFLIKQADAHARLLEPPSRASMWRMGFDSPENFDDDQTYCGGIGVQWDENHGRCGICGDSWSDFPRDHEAPLGKFATGTIVRNYDTGSWVPVIVDITTNHGGYFIFKLCPNNDISQDPDQRCFDQHILQTGKNGEAELLVSEELSGPVTMYIKLPDGVTCDQCIIQWTWIAANNWGSCHNGARGIGCGPQETFRSCADVSVLNRSQSKWKTEAEKMEMLKKLYFIMQKREKEKSSLLTRLKLLKLKREMIIKRSSFQNGKSNSLKKSNGRIGARNLKFHNLNLKRDSSKDSRDVVATLEENRENQTLSLETGKMRDIQMEPTTVRSDLQNHIKKIRKNYHMQNSLSKPQINAQDLKDYLRMNPIDMKKTIKNNILDFMNRKKSRREIQNKKLRNDDSLKHLLIKEKVQKYAPVNEKESNKISSMLVLPWWMRIMIERKKDHPIFVI